MSQVDIEPTSGLGQELAAGPVEADFSDAVTQATVAGHNKHGGPGVRRGLVITGALVTVGTLAGCGIASQVSERATPTSTTKPGETPATGTTCPTEGDTNQNNTLAFNPDGPSAPEMPACDVTFASLFESHNAAFLSISKGETIDRSFVKNGSVETVTYKGGVFSTTNPNGSENIYNYCINLGTEDVNGHTMLLVGMLDANGNPGKVLAVQMDYDSSSPEEQGIYYTDNTEISAGLGSEVVAGNSTNALDQMKAYLNNPNQIGHKILLINTVDTSQSKYSVESGFDETHHQAQVDLLDGTFTKWGIPSGAFNPADYPGVNRIVSHQG